MKCCIPPYLTCVVGFLGLLLVKPLYTQSSFPVVNVQRLNHPDNVIKVPEYEADANINVELSEEALSHPVQVTCRTLSSGKGITNVSFTRARIPVGRRGGSVLFDIVSPGRIVEVQCTGQSEGGSQFQGATSAGQPGYVQVTKRPTVSICSDVVVVPKDSNTYQMEVLFSENVTTHPVNVNCSVLSPVKVGSEPMKLKFFGMSAPVMTSKIKVPYELESRGDAVIVGCRASSEGASTPAANLQYTFNTSEGETAVFTFKVPQATFIPASVTSLGQTTIGRTVSYLVLEKPATNVTEFQCSLMPHNPLKDPAMFCPGSPGTPVPQTTSLGLGSVVVNLVTTNMTFEVNDLYKPLMIQVNGTSTQRNQRLLDVTCCRKNADPRYFVLATTILLWVDVFASVQFEWENVSVTSTVTPYSRFEPQCPCDLEVARCDIGCCCDEDCTSVEKLSFPCISGFFGGASQEAVFEYGCQETWPIAKNYLTVLCVITDNNPFLGMLYEFTSSPAGDSVQFESLRAQAQNSPYEYRESESRTSDEDDVNTGGYQDGSIVKTDPGFLTLPRRIASDACARYAPVVFLRNSDTLCTGEFSESLCSETSPWSALDYLVPSHTRQFSCGTSPQVLNLNNRVNFTTVPTNVAYFCTNDPSAFTTSVEEDWGLSTQTVSLFEPAEETNENVGDVPRCPFDDGVSKPEPPRFNASLGTCFNVVLKVEYHLYWRSVQILQARVKVTLGDIRNTSSVGRLLITQRFSTKFIHLKDVDLSQLPFIESEVNERSGNPGYLIGRKVLAKIEKNESVSLNMSFTVNQTTFGELGLWSTSSTGLCAGAKTSHVSFGVNTFSGCLLKLSLKEMANCGELRQTVLRNQQSLAKATHVARRGNSVLNKSEDWLPLLWPSSPVLSSNASESQTFGICENIPASLHYELLIKEAGKYQGVVQVEIIGARFRYSLRSWAFNCVQYNCKSCNGTNNTAFCKDSVQSFEVTSSVAFVKVFEQEMSKQKRSADSNNICYKDICGSELFYPLTTSYDGEDRELTIAYALMLVALVLLVLALTTSWLRDVRQWIAL